MRRFWIVMLVVATALAIALPAGAKKPDKPDRPGTGFKPTACQVDDVVASATVTDAGGTVLLQPDESGAFILTATELGGFNETRYTVEPATPGLSVLLCVEVELVTGRVSDLRVRWYPCADCGLYRATGKDLRIFNDGDVFSAGVSVADWTDPMTVAVMPLLKSDEATLLVTIGLDQP